MRKKRVYLKQVSDRCPKDNPHGEIFYDKCCECKYRGSIWVSDRGEKYKFTVECNYQRIEVEGGKKC